jgi:predicted DNA-binding ribbon-helix-helix protein
VRRTQLYLEDSDWKLLQEEARRRKSTISELMRQAIRQTYKPDFERRARAMRAIVGLWADRDDIGDTEEYIRNMRRDTRSSRFNW